MKSCHERYCYDDDCEEEHFQEKDFLSDSEAIKWAEELRAKCSPGNSVVYTDKDDGEFRVVKEWKP